MSFPTWHHSDDGGNHEIRSSAQTFLPQLSFESFSVSLALQDV